MNMRDVRIKTTNTGMGIGAKVHISIVHLPTGLTESMETLHDETRAREILLGRLRARVATKEKEDSHK